MKPDTRRKATAEYVDKKAKGARLIDGLARLKTQSFRLMADVVTNHADVLLNLRALKDAGADANGQIENFQGFYRHNLRRNLCGVGVGSFARQENEGDR